MNQLEEGSQLRLDYGKLQKVGDSAQDLVPVALQNAETGEVLFIGYANQQALAATLETRTAVLWSTTRDELWHKGATSGDVLDLVEVRVNCEQNSLLYRVRPRSGVCHTRDADGTTRRACYYRRIGRIGRIAQAGSELEFVT